MLTLALAESAVFLAEKYKFQAQYYLVIANENGLTSGIRFCYFCDESNDTDGFSTQTSRVAVQFSALTSSLIPVFCLSEEKIFLSLALIKSCE